MRVTRLLALGLICSCSEPSLTLPGASEAALEVAFGPKLDATQLPLLFRAHIPQAPAAGIPWLITGRLSDYHERALRRGELSEPLRERAIPLRFWRDEAGLWLQPTRLLEPASGYTLALTGSGSLRHLETEAGPPRLLERVFPAPGSSPSRVVVLCGGAAVHAEREVWLEPGHVPLVVTPGVFGLPRAGCLTLQVDGELDAPAVLPPRFGEFLADPQPFRPAAAESPPAVSCSGGTLAASACLEALDDCLLVTSPHESLWLLTQPMLGDVVVPAFVSTELARGLMPNSAVVLAGRAFSREAQEQPLQLTLTTAAPRRHLVLNEVLANPQGPEPLSEWVELVNDSSGPTTLDGLWLEDGGGSVPLPPEPVAPGEILLLVPKGFRASGLDVLPPRSARFVELASLGARGLTNSGEPLLLVGREGVVSRFPLISAPEAGRSVARRSLGSADDAAASFALHGSPGASPGEPNSFEP